MAAFNFKNPVFHPGLNVTVRAGDEYAHHPHIKPGEIVTLNCPDQSRDCGRALIIATLFYETLGDVPRDLLAFEHMPSCRHDIDELQRQLVANYGEDYGPGVTLIFFYCPFDGN